MGHQQHLTNSVTKKAQLSERSLLTINQLPPQQD